MQTTLHPITPNQRFIHPRLGEVSATGSCTQNMATVICKTSNSPAVVFRKDLKLAPSPPSTLPRRLISTTQSRIVVGNEYHHKLYGKVRVTRLTTVPGYYFVRLANVSTEMTVCERNLIAIPGATTPTPAKPKIVVIICNKRHKQIHTADTADAAWQKFSPTKNWSPRKCREHYKKLGYYSIRVKL